MILRLDLEVWCDVNQRNFLTTKPLYIKHSYFLIAFELHRYQAQFVAYNHILSLWRLKQILWEALRAPQDLITWQAKFISRWTLKLLILKYIHLMVNPVSPRTKCSTEIDKAQLHVQLYEGPSKDEIVFCGNCWKQRSIYIYFILISVFNSFDVINSD